MATKMIDSTSSREPKELAHRVNDGIEVTLLWFASTNRVVVRVNDEKTGERFELAVAGADALDAFYHPFAHAAWSGVEYATARR
jgi:hypothetical protein